MKKCVQYRPASIKVFQELCDDIDYLIALVLKDPMVYCYFPKHLVVTSNSFVKL